MSTPLGEIRVDERDDCVALIIRTTNRWRPWDVWTIVENPIPEGREYRGTKDLTYGHPGFRAVRGLQVYYIEDITYWGRKVGSRRSEDAARTLSVKALDKFLTWRDKQREIERSMANG